MPAFHGHDDDFLYEIQPPPPSSEENSPPFTLQKNSDSSAEGVLPDVVSSAVQPNQRDKRA
jgi:hypothetical protein